MCRYPLYHQGVNLYTGLTCIYYYPCAGKWAPAARNDVTGVTEVPEEPEKNACQAEMSSWLCPIRKYRYTQRYS